MTDEDGRWTVTISRNGEWPTVWFWTVVSTHRYPFAFRCGSAFTKDGARRKALSAKRSMERDDVTVVHP